MNKRLAEELRRVIDAQAYLPGMVVFARELRAVALSSTSDDPTAITIETAEALRGGERSVARRRVELIEALYLREIPSLGTEDAEDTRAIADRRALRSLASVLLGCALGQDAAEQFYRTTSAVERLALEQFQMFFTKIWMKGGLGQLAREGVIETSLGVVPERQTRLSVAQTVGESTVITFIRIPPDKPHDQAQLSFSGPLRAKTGREFDLVRIKNGTPAAVLMMLGDVLQHWPRTRSKQLELLGKQSA